jgi:hypothetical protein
MLLAALQYVSLPVISIGHRVHSNGVACFQDVVFLDEGLSTIITAIKVARQIFHRMKGMGLDSYARPWF